MPPKTEGTMFYWGRARKRGLPVVEAHVGRVGGAWRGDQEGEKGVLQKMRTYSSEDVGW